jgi:hypothetical protein
VLVGEWRQPAFRLFFQTITKAIVATQRQAVDNPDYSRFSKPADQFRNRDCTNANGYYIEQAFLVLL